VIRVDTAVFDRLLDHFLTTKDSRMGMGLAVRRAAIERDGGQLSASINEGPHASFYVLLTCAQP